MDMNMDMGMDMRFVDEDFENPFCKCFDGLPLWTEDEEEATLRERNHRPPQRWFLRIDNVAPDINVTDIAYNFLDHNDSKREFLVQRRNSDNTHIKYILVDFKHQACLWHLPLPCLLQHHSTIRRAELRNYPNHQRSPYVHLCPCAYGRAHTKCRDGLRQLLHTSAKDRKNDNLIRVDMDDEGELFQHSLALCRALEQCPVEDDAGRRMFPEDPDHRSVYSVCALCNESHWGEICPGPIMMEEVV